MDNGGFNFRLESMLCCDRDPKRETTIMFDFKVFCRFAFGNDRCEEKSTQLLIMFGLLMSGSFVAPKTVA